MYGEIYILGPCKLNCFYCIKNQIPSANKQNQLNTHYYEWPNFFTFLEKCKENNIETIYLSSINTDPILYEYIFGLVSTLHNKGFKVGIRTNAGNIPKDLANEITDKFDNISISINSFNNYISYKIAHSKNEYEIIKDILDSCSYKNKKVRITLVVNRYNINELACVIQKLKKWHKIIKYVQLRKLYVYDHLKDNVKKISDDYAFDFACNYIKAAGIKSSNFYTQEQYKIPTSHGSLLISLWDDRLDSKSVQALNYFTSGEIQQSIDTDNEIVPAYENK